MTPISDAFAKQGPHERKIRTMFPHAFAWQGSEPLFSKPLYILAFTNRSGSNLLADYLRQTKKFRGFGEGLNGDEIRRRLETSPVASFPDYISRLAGPVNEPGTWGIKASWDQVIMLQRANILSMFSGVQIIHSVRRDLLGQSVSHWIAHQTNQWTSVHKESGITPEFCQYRIEQILMDIIRSNTYIDQISQALGIPCCVVVYERLQKDPAAEMRRLAKALSIDFGNWQPGIPRISQQRNEVNDSFRQRCLEAWRVAVASQVSHPG